VDFYETVRREARLRPEKAYDPAPRASPDERVPPLEEFLRLVNCTG